MKRWWKLRRRWRCLCTLLCLWQVQCETSTTHFRRFSFWHCSCPATATTDHTQCSSNALPSFPLTPIVVSDQWSMTVWIIFPSAVVRDLGVLFHPELLMRQHVSRISLTHFFHRSVRRQLATIDWLQISWLVLSRLDYCNAILAGLPASVSQQRLCRVLYGGVDINSHVTTPASNRGANPIQYCACW